MVLQGASEPLQVGVLSMADLNLGRSYMQRLEEANKSPGPGDAAGGSVLGSCLDPLPVGSKLNLDLVPVHSLVQMLGPINARRGTRNLWFWLCAQSIRVALRHRG